MKSAYGKYLRVGVLVWAGCFIGLLLFYLLVLGPQEKSRIQTEKRFAETQRVAQVAREAAKPESKDKLKQQVADLEKRLRDFVAEQEDTTNLTLDIGQISTDVELSSFPITATADEGIVEIENCDYISAKNVNVNFTSGFNKFATFLNALEGNRPVIFIDTFSITRSREGTSDHKVDMKLAVLVGKDAKTKGADG
jgi:type II secretory pathway component PulM